MSRDVVVRCRCGRVEGVVHGVAPRDVNHVHCHCHDCRAFAHWLGGNAPLDARGGSDIVQVARARFAIERGIESLGCVRLTARGLHRWFATCCRIPIGNSNPGMPVIGMARCALDAVDDVFGPSVPFAGGSALPGPRLRTPLRTFLHASRLYFAWRGLAHPTPLFDRDGRPCVTPIVLRTSERDALREHPQA